MVNWNLQNKRKAVAALETCGRCINALILLVYSIFARLGTRSLVQWGLSLSEGCESNGV
jgi:hypothetical protein